MHTGQVTKREQLHELVDELDEKQVNELLQLASRTAESAPRRQEPSWFGVLRSGRGDLSERHEEILKAELGRPA